LQPLRRWTNLYTAHRHTRIARTSFYVLNLHLNRAGRIAHVEAFYGRQGVRHTQKGFQIAGNTQVRSSISAVWRQTNFEHLIRTQTEILSGRRTVWQVSIKYHDAGMGGTDANLIFSANHTL